MYTGSYYYYYFYYAVCTLGAQLCLNVWSSWSSWLSWHGSLLVIQLTVPSMLILLDSYIYQIDLIRAHHMRVWFWLDPL